MYADGNRNGVLTADIQRGIDPPLMPSEQLPALFDGVDFGAIPGLPPIDSGGTPPGQRPGQAWDKQHRYVQFGRYLVSRQPVHPWPQRRSVRRSHSGETGRTRVLKFDAVARRWRPL